jgi:adenosine deaminase
VLRQLPKVLLHDHLDGGLRPATVIELAQAAGHRLPTSEPDALREWFVEAASAGALERYLETFAHTVAVMQTAEALTRVAREAVVDLAADGVVYAELRFAPEQHVRGGMGLQGVVDAVLAGFDEGTVEASHRGNTIRVGLLLDAMRQADRSEEVARLAVANRKRVVGYDIAGPEVGFPVPHHLAAFDLLAEACLPVTVHAGEAGDLSSIWEAVTKAHARRIGHGVAIVQDIAGLGLPGSPAGPWDGGGFLGGPVALGVPVAPAASHPMPQGGQGVGAKAGSGAVGGEFAQLGALANWIRDWGVVLEMCPSSNVQTGAVESIAAHPITPLLRMGLPVSVNTDNRLMSGTSMTREITALMGEAGWTLRDVCDATVAAVRGAFIHADERLALIGDVIRPAYKGVGVSAD